MDIEAELDSNFHCKCAKRMLKQIKIYVDVLNNEKKIKKK